MKTTIKILQVLVSSMLLCSASLAQDNLPEGVYAKIETAKGDIVFKLHHDKVPITVANFVGLAEGTIENSLRKKGQPFYDGLTFHRLVSGKILQGGCPQGNGEGMPGYKFKDEFHKELKHDKPGVVSMANYGKNTNGSQFFICFDALPTLDKKHTVFGFVVEGIEVAKTLQQGDKMIKINIVRVGDEGKKFNTADSFPLKFRKKI